MECLEVRASKRSAESKYAQIVRLVEEAQAQKAPIHRLADRYAVWFTIAAIALASLSWAISGDSVYALAVLVVATPCPLILATPIAIMSGIDLAAHNGIIAKSGAAIEQLGEVDIAVFDKTGTLTLGIPKVTAIILPEPENQNPVGTGLALSSSPIVPTRLAPPSSLTPTHIPGRAGHPELIGENADGRPELAREDEVNPSEPNEMISVYSSDTPGLDGTDTLSYDKNTLLSFAASIEQLSTHILARAVVDAALERDLTLSPDVNFEETFGKGVQGRIPITPGDIQLAGQSVNDFIDVAVGNHSFMQHLAITLPPALLSERKRRVDAGQICSFIAVDHQIAGLLVLEDVPRPELARLSSDLKSAGIKETILLTGDSEVVAHQIGELAQVDRAIARCLPDDKLRIIHELELGDIVYSWSVMELTMLLHWQRPQ